MAESWWPLYRITFSRQQMWWLIQHYGEIKENYQWPEKPGKYVEPPKQACKEAKRQGWEGLCITCPFKPCLNPPAKTPMKNRYESQRNKVCEIMAELDRRLELVMTYIAGYPRPMFKIDKNGRKRVEKGE